MDLLKSVKNFFKGNKEEEEKPVEQVEVKKPKLKNKINKEEILSKVENLGDRLGI